ncbi:MAG: metallophosphoesterase family protein [Desulfobacteraceae bacterium]|jgi:serine/threonine protein phosphatase 1
MNENSKSFIIGDLHGCRDMLEEMLNIIPWDSEKDNLIFIGDYIDRGNDSKGVIDILIKLMETSSNIQCLMGNHESLFLDYFYNRNENAFLINGGIATLNSYRVNDKICIPPEHVSFVKSLKTLVELDDYYIVHAGLMPGIEIEKQSIKDKLWIREDFIFSEYDFGKKVIFGHTPFPAPYIVSNKIGLDTGAVFGNKLTCIELPDEKFYQVGAKRIDNQLAK